MKFGKLIAAALTCLLAASPAMADGTEGHTGPFTPIDAQAVIDACWAQSDDLRNTGGIADYGDGLDVTTACMEDAVLEHIDAWLLPEFAKDADAYLHRLRDLHGELYFRIYADNRYCSGGVRCGLLPGMRYIESYIVLLETVLRDIAMERNFRHR